MFCFYNQMARAVRDPKTGKWRAPKKGERYSASSGGYTRTIPTATVTPVTRGSAKTSSMGGGETTGSMDKYTPLKTAPPSPSQTFRSTGATIQEKTVTMGPEGEVTGSINQRIRAIGPYYVETRKEGRIPTISKKKKIIDKTSYTPSGKIGARTSKKTFVERAEQASEEKKPVRAGLYTVLSRPKELTKETGKFFTEPFYKPPIKTTVTKEGITREYTGTQIVEGVRTAATSTAAAIYTKPEIAIPRIATDIGLTYGVFKGIGKAQAAYKTYKFEQAVKLKPSQIGAKFKTTQKGLPIVEEGTGAVLKGKQLQIKPSDFDVLKEAPRAGKGIQAKGEGLYPKYAAKPTYSIKGIQVTTKKPTTLTRQTRVFEYKVKPSNPIMDASRLLPYSPKPATDFGFKSSVKSHLPKMFRSKKAQIGITREVTRQRAINFPKYEQTGLKTPTKSPMVKYSVGDIWKTKPTSKDLFGFVPFQSQKPLVDVITGAKTTTKTSPVSITGLKAGQLSSLKLGAKQTLRLQTSGEFRFLRPEAASISAPITPTPTPFNVSSWAGIPKAPKGSAFKIPKLDDVFRVGKKKKGPKIKYPRGTYKPSLVGIELFKTKGLSIPKAPRLTAAIGIRRVVK